MNAEALLSFSSRSLSPIIIETFISSRQHSSRETHLYFMFSSVPQELLWSCHADGRRIVTWEIDDQQNSHEYRPQFRKNLGHNFTTNGPQFGNIPAATRKQRGHYLLLTPRGEHAWKAKRNKGDYSFKNVLQVSAPAVEIELNERTEHHQFFNQTSHTRWQSQVCESQKGRMTGCNSAPRENLLAVIYHRILQHLQMVFWHYPLWGFEIELRVKPMV